MTLIKEVSVLFSSGKAPSAFVFFGAAPEFPHGKSSFENLSHSLPMRDDAPLAATFFAFSSSDCKTCAEFWWVS